MEIQTPHGLLYTSTLQRITVNAQRCTLGMGDVPHTQASVNIDHAEEMFILLT